MWDKNGREPQNAKHTLSGMFFHVTDVVTEHFLLSDVTEKFLRYRVKGYPLQKASLSIMKYIVLTGKSERLD